MKIRDLACISCAIAMLATPGHAGCEKWKSEIMSLVGASAKYYDAYMDYRSGDIELGSFQSKASKAVASIDEVTERLNTIASCAGFEGRADKVAFREAGTGRSLTYGDLAYQSGLVAAALPAHQIMPEERMAMLVLDQVEFPVLFWGAIKAGVIPVPLNTLLAASV